MQTLLKIKSYERKHLRMLLFHQNKNDCVLLNGPFFFGVPKTKLHFILPAMKSNVNRIYWWVKISFPVGFISGLM